MKLAYTPDLESGEETHGGSSPPIGTIRHMSKLADKAREMVKKRQLREHREEPDPRPIYLCNPKMQVWEPVATPSGNLAFDKLVSLERKPVRVPQHMLATVFYEGWTEEYVIFVDHEKGKALPRLDKLEANFLIETIHEIGIFMTEGRLDHDDGDLLIRHLNAELLKRL